jgi:DNA-binding CsgD family transcriptional regulator
MDPLDLTQLFVERCERSAPASELKATFQMALEHMGFRYFACCSHVNPKRPPRQAVVLHNYPSSWARTFAEQNLHERDPVFLRAESEILPFHWNAPEFRATLSSPQKRILQEAARNGVAHGYTVPLHLPWAAGALRASCSVVPDSKSISPRAYREVQVMATYLYASVGYHDDVRAARETAMRGGPLLSLRERQCLELAAYGKSDWDISLLLGISEHTVHKHVEAAKRRLGVSTRVQAIVWAAQRREISLGDVVRTPSARSRRRSVPNRIARTASSSQRRSSLRSDHQSTS